MLKQLQHIMAKIISFFFFSKATDDMQRQWLHNGINFTRLHFPKNPTLPLKVLYPKKGTPISVSSSRI